VKEEIDQNGMEKESTSPFQGEQDPERFLPGEHNKINQLIKYSQENIVPTNDTKRSLWSYIYTYAKEVGSFFVVIT
jgi:hypothetical protein